MTAKTVFQRIIDREIPADIVYEDDRCIAFKDIHPAAPVHVLIVPKQLIATVNDVTPADEPVMGHLFSAAKAVAAKLGLAGGYRIVINCGPDAGQEVMHVHLHLLGGRKFGWPPG
ncbi:MAG: histidine triad nucleotide-binding protein [Thermoguttaceae bacterium]|nr:histidine triad nucleotide-binding protein [Thermoguttaceae bacterium]MDW8077264.1 histidine triad nucleotide-binding protein [Thermoguttaceae bacterium]